MNDKEFEEFFKSLENNDNSGSAKDDYAGDEFVFSGFFEDNTTADKNKTEKPSERRAAFDFSDDDDFAPPPPEEDEDEASFAPPPSIDDEFFQKTTKRKKKKQKRKSLRRIIRIMKNPKKQKNPPMTQRQGKNAKEKLLPTGLPPSYGFPVFLLFLFLLHILLFQV